MRDSDAGPEVLLVQRNPASRFMGGAWVFPGGAVHGDEEAAADTAIRETEEEAGLLLDPAPAPAPWSRVVTPAPGEIPLGPPVFVSRAPGGAPPAGGGQGRV